MAIHAHVAAAPAENDWQIFLLDVERVRPNPEQPRKDFDEKRLAELAESIRATGVVKPILVVAAGDHYVIVDGERRWRASKMAARPLIPAIVHQVDPLTGALVETAQRVGLNVVEEALAVARFVAENGGVAEAARLLGKSETWIAKRRKVGTAPDFVLTCGSKDLDALYEIALLAETDPDGARKLISGGIKKTNLRDSARKARKGEIAIDVTAADAPTALVLDEAPGEQKGARGGGREGLPGVGGALGAVLQAGPKNDTGRAAVEQFFAAPSEAAEVRAVDGWLAEPGEGGAAGPVVARPPKTLVVEGVRLERNTLMLESGGGTVELQLSPDVERELFELIREHLCP
jgi:ParB family transcriptional regulator, chromosome partitioning protein